MTRELVHRIHAELARGNSVGLTPDCWDEYDDQSQADMIAGVIEKIDVIFDQMKILCPDCKGTGEYRGFDVTEPCKTCRPVV